MKLMEDIVAFHEKFKLEYNGKPRQLPDELMMFRCKFMAEELDEYIRNAEEYAARKDDPDFDGAACLADQLDALVDLVYVALGTAYLQGFPFEKAWDTVQEANMAKVRAERAADSKRGSTFDVVKPAGWKAPCHLKLVKG